MEMRQTAAGFAALAQETRLRLLTVLANCGAEGMAAGELAEALQQAPSTLSFHLSALEQAGLARSRRQGRSIVYAVQPEATRKLLMVLATISGAGQSEAIDAIARLVPVATKMEIRMEPAFNVLFICTRNSARSIMAEAILGRISRGRFNAYSAGSRPASAPMPEVLDRLESFGHDIAKLHSKSWETFSGPSAPRMDFVITLCDPADSEACPDLGDRPITANWPFPDPAKFHGSEVERTALLNELYGMIRRRLEAFANLPFCSLDRIALKARLDELGDAARMAK